MKKGEHWTEERRLRMSETISKKWRDGSDYRERVIRGKTKDTKERFWSKVDIKGKNECWEWKAGRFSQGYGAFHLNGQSIQAHRTAFLLSSGILTAEKYHVLHKCDNPVCCNPNHLFAGSHQDNMNDMAKKKRANPPCGEKQWHSILTEQEVHNIRNLKGKMTQEKLAQKFNTDQTNISLILNCKSWKHI